MSYVPSQSDAIASLYALHFYEINTQMSPSTMMDNFYARIIPLKFQSAKEALSYCRQLAKEYGFTMKQETSSNKNIYIYCSREGVADSSKQTKRKRSSIKCDCKWRIVLFKDDNNQWEFRKSNNPQHAQHNHDLIPENIPAPWPPNVLQRIAEYANSGFLTGDIRQLMQQEFPNLSWDERRFYNRLAEERKKIKIRETEKRVIETIVLAARVASLACSSYEYTNKVKAVLQQAFDDICESANIDSTSVMSLSQDNMTTITLPSSSTADIVCNYPAGSITVKNIPAQKGRPSKKNIHLRSQQQLLEVRDHPNKSQNDLITPQPSELALQSQTELLTVLQSQSEIGSIQKHNQSHSSQILQNQSQVQFQSQQFSSSQETINIQEEPCQPFPSNVGPFSQCNSNELNPSFLLQTQPQPVLQSQMNLYPLNKQFQMQEKFCYSRSQSHIQFVPQNFRTNNQSLISQEYSKMKFDSNQQQILASQLCSSQIQEHTDFAKNSLSTQTLQEMLFNSYPQIFIQPQEKNINQKQIQGLQPIQLSPSQSSPFVSTSEIQSNQDLLHQFNLIEFQPEQEAQGVDQQQLTSNSIQSTNTDEQNQNQQTLTPRNIPSEIGYEKSRKKHKCNKPPAYDKPLPVLEANV
ncbi:hypothetical protein RhiirA4_512375 [Rhizophagus irregularis]|uniref:FAR1 domain-containing protein n=1 Tax=Rhizophagus irregularis TaxID=588596 RepID=A0A2I1FST4_9GLOM|nr:hypothetical protein RhiirA4_512375 [Rhizophagus irregularis]